MGCHSTFFFCVKSSLIDDCSCSSVSQRLYKQALVISGVFCAIVSFVLASVIFSGISGPVMILGLVISLVLCGALLISALYYSRHPYVIITPIVDSGTNGSISSSTEESSSLDESIEVSATSVSVLDSTIDDRESSDDDFVLAETPESYSETIAASMLDSSTVGEEFFDEESTSILNAAFNLSSSIVSDDSIKEEDSLEIDLDLSWLYDSQLVIDAEATVDATSYVGEMTSLPKGFLSIVAKNYPRIIYQICIQEFLTIQELRLLIDGLIESRKLENYPENLRMKLQSSRLSIMEFDCRDIELQPLDEILLKECPFYFLDKLIALGDRELPIAERISPAVYWTSRLGFVSQINTIVIPSVWILSRVTTREEYKMMLDHSKNNTWEQTRDLISHLQNCLKVYLDNEYQPSFSCTKSSVGWDLGTSSWLLYLCKHGVSWEQLQLFTKIDSRSVNFLYEIEQQSRGGHLARNIVSVFAYINEKKENFDPNIALFTWEEWIEDQSESSRRGERWRAHESTIKLLNAKRNELEALKETPFGCEELSGVPRYTYDSCTGAMEV
ncbi:conserved hypothetical protein [Chlamydia caviae GPIC]|uniref:DUF1389 domain-containing protein n=2 Tax=Chlamydia caviae TaxID=83557 RepID=Q822P0_CHLCV|nr:conserved hypothetical protein [Chlamydia caviae GPIC]